MYSWYQENGFKNRDPEEACSVICPRHNRTDSSGKRLDRQEGKRKSLCSFASGSSTGNSKAAVTHYGETKKPSDRS